MRPFRIIIFGLVMALYIWYPLQMIRSQEHILDEGYACKMALRPVDPYDAFRGRYIALHYDNILEMVVDTLIPQQQVYVSVKETAKGYCVCDKVYDSPPADPYIRMSVQYVRSSGMVSVQFPSNMQRYYLNEKIAPMAEEAYRNLIRQPLDTANMELKAYADLRILGGEVLIDEVYFEGRRVADYVREAFLGQ